MLSRLAVDNPKAAATPNAYQPGNITEKRGNGKMLLLDLSAVSGVHGYDLRHRKLDPDVRIRCATTCRRQDRQGKA
jgi:hypothetical protein